MHYVIADSSKKHCYSVDNTESVFYLRYRLNGSQAMSLLILN